MIGTDETDFPRNILAINRQAASLRKAFAYNSSKDIELSKIQLTKIIHSDGLLGRFLGPLGSDFGTGEKYTPTISQNKAHYIKWRNERHNENN